MALRSRLSRTTHAPGARHRAMESEWTCQNSDIDFRVWMLRQPSACPSARGLDYGAGDPPLLLVTLVLLLLTGSTVLASRSHRDSVGCGMPISSAKAEAVTARGPVIRLIILAFITSEYCIVFALRAPGRSQRSSSIHRRSTASRRCPQVTSPPGPPWGRWLLGTPVGTRTTVSYDDDGCFSMPVGFRSRRQLP